MPASSGSSASRTGCRTSSSSRCRRCSRCCAPSSTSRGRCSARWSACSTRPPASSSSSPASGSTASARARCCSAVLRWSRAGPCSRRSCPRSAGCSRSSMIMGAGNGVFHPADFAILNANVAPRRLGHAYSTHGILGNLGYAVAPIVSFGLAALVGWRGALGAMGLVGHRRARRARHAARVPDVASRDRRAYAHAAWRASRCSGRRRSSPASRYFIVQTTASVGMQTFARKRAATRASAFRSRSRTRRSRRYLLGGSAGHLRSAASSPRAPTVTTGSRPRGLLVGRRSSPGSSRSDRRWRCCCRCSPRSASPSAPPVRRAT